MQATACLLQQIEDVQPDKLRPLLDKVFPFVSVEALRPIVVAVLRILQPVPKSNLHILAEDDDVFWDLPLSVQQQVRSRGLQSHQAIRVDFNLLVYTQLLASGWHTDKVISSEIFTGRFPDNKSATHAVCTPKRENARLQAQDTGTLLGSAQIMHHSHVRHRNPS